LSTPPLFGRGQARRHPLNRTAHPRDRRAPTAWGDIIGTFASRIAEIFLAVTSDAPASTYAAAANNGAATSAVPDVDLLKFTGDATAIESFIIENLWPAIDASCREWIDQASKRARNRRIDDRTCFIALVLRMNGHRVPSRLRVSPNTVTARLKEWKRAEIWADMKRIANCELEDSLN
jgi:hypothetical protein